MSEITRGLLMTELLSAEGQYLDELPLEGALERLHRADLQAAESVRAAHGEVAEAVKLIRARITDGGRVFYLGAGTSGRLATLDAAELPPTFGVPETLFQAIIAGGADALTHAVDGAEDQGDAAASALCERKLCPKDVVLGIAAGGTTPFVHGGLAYAQELGAATIFMACVPKIQVADSYDLSIRLLSGPEEVQGSTRMKAGTATKLCLNAISTMVWVGLGKVHRGRMVDVSTQANQKLIDRGERLVMDLGGLERSQSQDLLRASAGQVKPAVVMARLDVDCPTATRLLQAHDGHLGACLEQGR